MKNILRFVRNGLIQFELSTHLRHSRIALLFCSFMLMIFFCFLLINGCKKSPSDDPVSDENKAIHAAAVAGYQALGAGTSFPFEALKLSSPTGSAIRDLSDEKSLLYSLIGPTIFKHNSLISDPLTYQDYLNLYFSNSTTGNVGTLSYYSDAEGTQPAGSMTLTLPANITDISDPTSYVTFPANIKIAVNITAGNLPCKGNISIGYTDESGANSMTGTLTLSRVDVVLTFNLTLDKQFNTSGSITITENGTTLAMTNVHGNVTGLSYDVKISPSGWTGTGTLDLSSSSIKVKLNTETGKSIIESDNHGNLNIDYADGTHEIVYNAMAAELTGTSNASVATSITAANGTPQSAAINTAFDSPLVVLVTDQNGNPMREEKVTFSSPSTGQSCTFTGGVTTITAITNTQGEAQVTITANATTGSYNVTASVAGVTTAAGFSLTNTAIATVIYKAPLIYTFSQRKILTINNKGQSIGYLPGTRDKVPVYWPTPTSQPQTLKISEGDSSVNIYSLNDNGQIVGNGYYYTYWSTGGDGVLHLSNPLFWSSPTAQPQKLAAPVNFQYAVATSINNKGEIVGYGLSLSSVVTLLYWPSPTAQPQVLQTPAGFTSVSNIIIGPNGQIIEVYGYYSAYWVSPGVQGITLKGLNTNDITIAQSVNAAGVIAGNSVNQSGYSAPVTWVNETATAQVLPLPAGASVYSRNAANSINTAGVIVGMITTGTINLRSVGVIWKNGQVQDLNTLIPPGNSESIGEATQITDQGWILGFIANSANTTQFILIPK